MPQTNQWSFSRPAFIVEYSCYQPITSHQLFRSFTSTWTLSKLTLFDTITAPPVCIPCLLSNTVCSCTSLFLATNYFTELPIDTETQLKDQVFLSSCSSALIVKQIGMEIVKTFTMGLCTKSISSQEEISPVGERYLSMWNTDGMQVFNSSTFTVWPLLYY